jgi:hypothetical protein
MAYMGEVVLKMFRIIGDLSGVVDGAKVNASQFVPISVAKTVNPIAAYRSFQNLLDNILSYLGSRRNPPIR